jgi:hypothetical protein
MRAPHLPFSLNLVFSDFYLFDKVERVVMGRMFGDGNEIFQCVVDALNGTSRSELEAIFEEWLVGFNACIQQGGDDGE